MSTVGGGDGIGFGDANHPGPTFNCIKRLPQLLVEELEQSRVSAPPESKASFCPVYRGKDDVRFNLGSCIASNTHAAPSFDNCDISGVKIIRIDPLEPDIWLYYVY